MKKEREGKQIVIVGLGLTGCSCLNFFMAQGIFPRVMDTRSSLSLAQLPTGVECYFGGLHEPWLLQADLIVLSPGIPMATPELQRAVEAGIEIVGDIELFCRYAEAPIIAITGSNGKSTVTTLVGEMAEAAGWRVGVGGNIGRPALTLLQPVSAQKQGVQNSGPQKNALPIQQQQTEHEQKSYQLYVLELSSFQLETTHSLRAAAATVLNLSADHMDRYPQGMEQYQQAKLKIYHQAAWAIYNGDDLLTTPPDREQQKVRSFALTEGDYHLMQQGEEEWLCYQEEKVLNTGEMQLVGRHNMLNALAALALADAVALPRAAAIEALKCFSGLKHRFQLVWERNGVRWINDSKSTNVGSTLAALSGLKVEGVLHLLLGGDGKSADFTPLQAALAGESVRLYCYGRDGALLAALRPEIAVRTVTLKESMCQIAAQVKPGDLVLLSPACASLDQYRNYEQRGDEFARLAQELG